MILRDDKYVVLIVVGIDDKAYNFASDRLKNNREVRKLVRPALYPVRTGFLSFKALEGKLRLGLR